MFYPGQVPRLYHHLLAKLRTITMVISVFRYIMTSRLLYRYQRSVEAAASIFEVVHTSYNIYIETPSLHNFVYNG
jgi:hypothetical protein